jgi:hypothetical protein
MKRLFLFLDPSPDPSPKRGGGLFFQKQRKNTPHSLVGKGAEGLGCIYSARSLWR